MDSSGKRRLAVNNACRDITEWLCLLWKKYGIEMLELLEYEQYYDLPKNEYGRITITQENEQSKNYLHQLLLEYRKHLYHRCNTNYNR